MHSHVLISADIAYADIDNRIDLDRGFAISRVRAVFIRIVVLHDKLVAGIFEIGVPGT